MTAQHPNDRPPMEPHRLPIDLTYEAPVYSADGELLGHIAEIEGQRIRVAVRAGADVWLERVRILDADSERVVVEFDASEFSAHAVEPPPVGDAMLSVAEQERQRRRMEEELAKQRSARN